MKKTIARLTVALILLAVLLLTAGIVRKAGRANEIAERVKNLPDFAFPNIEGGLFSSDEITKGPLLVTYFHPECDHCQYEISSLFKSNILDGNTKVVMVSFAGPEMTRAFTEKFKTVNDTLLWVLSDTSMDFREIFGTDVIPSNFIYDENLRLVKALKGEIRTETIFKYLHGVNQ